MKKLIVSLFLIFTFCIVNNLTANSDTITTTMRVDSWGTDYSGHCRGQRVTFINIDIRQIRYGKIILCVTPNIINKITQSNRQLWSVTFTIAKIDDRNREVYGTLLNITEL